MPHTACGRGSLSKRKLQSRTRAVAIQGLSGLLFEDVLCRDQFERHRPAQLDVDSATELKGEGMMNRAGQIAAGIAQQRLHKRLNLVLPAQEFEGSANQPDVLVGPGLMVWPQ